MMQTIYLVATRFGVDRMTKRRPELGRNEVGVAIKITIPDGAFRSPVIEATLDVADGVVMQPIVTIEALPDEQDAQAAHPTETTD